MQSALFVVVDELQLLLGAARDDGDLGPPPDGARRLLNDLMARSRTPGMGTKEIPARFAAPQSASLGELEARLFGWPAGCTAGRRADGWWVAGA